jgi:serine/threonine protein kinase/tetratricopeptide (TPR) repeat protein
VKTLGKRTCPVCGTLFPEDSESCPVCALRAALEPQNGSPSGSSPELRFEHYTVLKNADGTPLELGRGAMGVTYKAFDVHLQCPVALKIINARLIGDSSARLRFVREARAAASVRHPNVAWVTHLGESGGNYFYIMEFVEGETVEKLVQRSGRLDPALALQIVEQVAAGLTAIEKQHLVHRDIKPSNIMVSLEDRKLESVKIIDLGLAKGVAEENTVSTLGSFVGTPEYASPEQFAGVAADIRSDLYSLGVTLWEMLSGKLPFRGSAAELMYQHQHAALPSEKLRSMPTPIIALLEILLAKDAGQRFAGPAQLQKALSRVRRAVDSGLRLTSKALRSIGSQATEQPKGMQQNPGRHLLRWLAVSVLCLTGLLLGWFYFSGHRGSYLNQRGVEGAPAEKSIAVLPFESLSANKDDSYFADGVQDEILANIARISQLKVISRTSVMQYRADTKRDLRQIANALGVATVVEGTVRRDGSRVRITVKLVDAGTDHTIWSEIYDRNLTDIFAIQSEVAETIGWKLTATLPPEEKKLIEKKLTDNLEAYDLYLQAKEALVTAKVSPNDVNTILLEAVGFLERAVQLDPKFTMAYCMTAKAHDFLYVWYDRTSERRALGDAAVKNALQLQPGIPEVHLTYALHLYGAYRDYDRARVQLEIAKRSLPNDTETILLEASMDRREGEFEKAIRELNRAIRLDPNNTVAITDLAHSLFNTRQFRAAGQAFDRLIALLPDQPLLKVEKAWLTTFMKTGDEQAVWSAINALPASMADDRGLLWSRLNLALNDRNWSQAAELLHRMRDFKDDDLVGCYEILFGRLQSGRFSADPSVAEHREELNRKVQASPADWNLLSRLAIVDAWLGNKEAAISEAKSAVEMLPISKDAVDGPQLMEHLAVVYAWTNECDLAFQVLDPLAKTPNGIYYGPMKLDPRWEPLRADPRLDKLLAELAPED